jgi:hypothetical protein
MTYVATTRKASQSVIGPFKAIATGIVGMKTTNYNWLYRLYIGWCHTESKTF